MAAKKGKTTKKAGTKGKKAQNSHSFRDEIIILLTLAAAILLILSNFGLGGISRKCSFCIFVRNLWTAGVYHAGLTFFGDCFCIFK